MPVTQAQSAASLFACSPLVVAALHLPDLVGARRMPMAQLEDYLLSNAAVFAQAGIPSIMLQDQTKEPGPATPETLAIMGSLGRLLRTQYPQFQLGIIVQAHDHAAALAVAHAVGAAFVCIKVYVGGVMAADGPRDALGPGRASTAAISAARTSRSSPMCMTARTIPGPWFRTSRRHYGRSHSTRTG